MTVTQVVGAFQTFASWSLFVLAGMVGALVIVGIVNGVYVVYLTMSSSRARNEEDPSDGPLPHGFISMYTYVHLLADVLLVVVAIELMETLIAFQIRSDPTEYLTGVIGVALVALARRIIVFFNPEAKESQTSEMYAYAALVAALAGAYAVIGYLG